MKTKLMAMMMVAGGSLFAQSHFSVGVGIGTPGYGGSYQGGYDSGPQGPYAPAPVASFQPPCPGPGYVWIDGYNDAYGAWTPGYWSLPPYEGAFWIGPRFSSGRFVAGYWGGQRFVGPGRPEFSRGFNNGFRAGFRDDHRDDRRDFNRGPAQNRPQGRPEQGRPEQGRPNQNRGGNSNGHNGGNNFRR